jgi:hypothetical protein
VKNFLELLAIQRWDDHRFYHQSRINQTLHLISAISFLCAYALLFVDPATAALVAWGVSMTTRQAGHFFFEPRGFDQINQVSDEYKEEVKVGYNMRRKVVLLSVWGLLPLALWFFPSMGGLIEPATDTKGWLHDVGMAWLSLGVTAVLLRVLQLWVKEGSPVPGIAWATKIITDPVWDILQYYKAPFYLLKGELLDPMPEVRRS